MAALKLTKKGLKCREIKECITSIFNYPLDNGDVTRAVDAVVQNTSSREKYVNSGSADRRFSASNNLVHEGFVSPTKAGSKGPQQDFLELSQENLREIFLSKRMLLLHILHQENKISNDYQNAEIADTDLCTTIDKVSDDYVAEITQEPKKGSITGTMRDREYLKPVTTACNDTLMSLLQFDIATSYNLMAEEEATSWRNQVREIATYGKLMTILEIYHNKKGASFYVKA